MEKVQDVCRVFATTDINKPQLRRKHIRGTYCKFANVPDHCYMFNDNIKNIEKDKLSIDIMFYVSLAVERIRRFKCEKM
jgi:hypothetical protein